MKFIRVLEDRDLKLGNLTTRKRRRREKGGRGKKGTGKERRTGIFQGKKLGEGARP